MVLGDAIEMASSTTKNTNFSWLAFILDGGVLALLIPIFFIVETTIPGPLPVNTLPTQLCGGFGPDCGANAITPNDLIQAIFWVGVIIVILYFVLGLFPLESNFSSFWRRIEESNAKKTAHSKSQMAGAFLLLGVVILLAVSMYFVGFLVH